MDTLLWLTCTVVFPNTRSFGIPEECDASSTMRVALCGKLAPDAAEIPSAALRTEAHDYALAQIDHAISQSRPLGERQGLHFLAAYGQCLHQVFPHFKAAAR